MHRQPVVSRKNIELRICPVPLFPFSIRFPSQWPLSWTLSPCWQTTRTLRHGKMKGCLPTECLPRMPPFSLHASVGRSWWTRSCKESSGSRTNMVKSWRSLELDRKGKGTAKKDGHIISCSTIWQRDSDLCFVWRYLDAIERALAAGDVVLIENLEETLDPVLGPLLGRETIKKGR